MKPYLSFFLPAALLLFTAPGRAQDNPVAPAPSAPPPPTPTPAPGVVPTEPPFTIDLDIVGYKTAGTAGSLIVAGPVAPPSEVLYDAGQTYESIILGIRYALPYMRFELELPYGLESSSGPRAFGNLGFGMYYRTNYGPLRVEAGGIFTLPTLDIETTTGAVTQSPSIPTQLFLSRGGDRAWLWFPDFYTPVAPSVRVLSAEDHVLQHATELTFAPMIATDAGVTSIFALQASEEVAAHVSILHAGARVEAVALFGATKAGFLTVMPFAGIAGRVGFLDVGALFDFFNEPDSTLASGPGWGLRIRGGARF